MNTWIIVGIIATLLVFGGIAVYASTNPSTSSGCGACDGKCTAEKNCGLATCGAANGGTCSCGAR